MRCLCGRLAIVGSHGVRLCRGCDDSYDTILALVLSEDLDALVSATTEIPPAPETILAPAPKACGCGRTHDAYEWSRLPYVGIMRDAVEAVELRNCQCSSTLAVSVAS